MGFLQTFAEAERARPTLHVSPACDHRILYGADGARFLDHGAQLLTSPPTLLV
jgi:pyruvate/2-oxoglutarate dehydrogenase complex dihydrolipoamide acyltransferase (E2) component